MQGGFYPDLSYYGDTNKCVKEIIESFTKTCRKKF